MRYFLIALLAFILGAAFNHAFAQEKGEPIFFEGSTIFAFQDGSVYVCKRGSLSVDDWRNGLEDGWVALDCQELTMDWKTCAGKEGPGLLCRERG